MATTTTAAAIEVIAVSAISAGNLKALVSVRIGPALVLHKVRVVQQPAQRPWVSMPTEKWEDRDGKVHYVPLVALTGSLKTRVEAAILDEALRQGVITTGHGRTT